MPSEKIVEGEDPLEALWDIKTERKLSHLEDLAPFLGSSRLRVQRRAFLLADFLLDEEGELCQDKVRQALLWIEKQGHIYYPEEKGEFLQQRHLVLRLEELSQKENFFQKIKQLRQPLCHGGAERLVRYALGLPVQKTLTTRGVRVALLSACFSLIRQNIGSCFATAPCILIHQQYVEVFLEDLIQLLTVGKLQRTFGGVLYEVPLSPHLGKGALRRPFPFKKEKLFYSASLLRAWEAIGLIASEESVEEKLKKQGALIRAHLSHVDHWEGLIHEVVSSRQNEKGSFFPIREGLEEYAALSFCALFDHPLLRAWEFTLASFSEVKMEFSRWNLYLSLGLSAEEGIGKILYTFLEEKLQESHQKALEAHAEYESLWHQVQTVEALFHQAGGVGEARRLQVEYNTKVSELRYAESQREHYREQSIHYSSFFVFLIKQYETQFPEYFQELYDADMLDLDEERENESYADRPAGFRLVYKQRRTNAALWTWIHNADQYIQALVNFFLSTEGEIQNACHWEEGKQAIGELTTAIVHHIRTPLFLEEALARMRQGHKTLSQHLFLEEEKRAKPWAYVSGGTMATLLKTYCRREQDFHEEARWVESPLDLLIFFLDVLKATPSQVTEEFLIEKDRGKGMLAYSPSHAFILYPGLPFFREGWQDQGFTYTWVRDHLLLPGRHFYQRMSLSEREQLYLIEEWNKRLRPPFSPVHILGSKGTAVVDFRSQVLEESSRQASLQKKLLLADLFDAFLYEMLPLLTLEEGEKALHYLLKEVLPQESIEEAIFQGKKPLNPFLSAKELLILARHILVIKEGKEGFSWDLQGYFFKKAQEGGWAPTPLRFADTNWADREGAHSHFAFLVNPGTLELELWRTDPLGSEGMPMTPWKPYLDGTIKKSWGVYPSIFEYAPFVPAQYFQLGMR